MSRKFKDKYRISSTRLQNWNYSWRGVYFITICIRQYEHFFGKILNGRMVLSHLGVLADVLWHETRNRAINIDLGPFVVMPNHIHGLLILNGSNTSPEKTGNFPTVETTHALSQGIIQRTDVLPKNNLTIQSSNLEPIQITNRSIIGQMETTHALSLQNKTIGQSRFQKQERNSVSSIIGGYKSAVTKHANRLKMDFGWQSRFHEIIIRDPKSYEIISEYIIGNPSKWESDKFFN